MYSKVLNEYLFSLQQTQHIKIQSYDWHNIRKTSKFPLQWRENFPIFFFWICTLYKYVQYKGHFSKLSDNAFYTSMRSLTLGLTLNEMIFRGIILKMYSLTTTCFSFMYTYTVRDFGWIHPEHEQWTITS